jgi:hypothetical protein
MADALQALWWVPAGHLPTVAEAEGRLAHLREHGPSPLALTFSELFKPSGEPAPQARIEKTPITCG